MALFYLSESSINDYQKKTNNLINITSPDKSIFNKLYNNEALTAEGLFVKDQDTCNKIAEWFRSNNKCKSNTLNVYNISGKIMNNFYHLTGDNKYNDNIHICCIDWVEAKVDNPYKSQWRWFSDVVDNNAKREIAKKNPYYKHYYSIYYGNIGYEDK